MSSFVELYDNVFVLSFWHFVFEFHAILTKWNTKYKKKILFADGAGALYFLFLADFVDGASV